MNKPVSFQYEIRFACFALCAFGGLVGCSHNEAGHELRVNAGVEKIAPIEVPAVEDVKEDDLTVRQVAFPDSDQDISGRLQVQQLVDDKAQIEYSFDDVEGDHPCNGEGRNTDACRAASQAIAAAAGQSGQKGSARSAAAELQTLTNKVIDPETFDPQRTIDEIGRGSLLSSQAAQALGSDFLALPDPVQPTEPVDDGVGPDGANLPPVVLDITVTQGAPSGS